MTAPLRPTSELVAVGWIGLALPTVGVGTRLPAADDAMRANGFVRVDVVGGNVDIDVPLRSPVAVAECWWPSPEGSHLPPWNHAAQLAQRLYDATYDRALMGSTVTLPGNYAPARVLTVIPLGEPQRVPSDPAFFARYELRLQLAWLSTT